MSSSSAATAVTESEIIVATIIPTKEQEAELSKQVSSIEYEAAAIVIKTDGDYADAAEFGKRVKQEAARVTGFFKPMKDDAHKAHKTICDREKELLKPLINAEAVLKRTMGEYSLRKERERREAEELARRIAEEEAQRKLAEAVKLESDGDISGAESALMDAAMADSASRTAVVYAEPPKVKGVSTSSDWRITSVNPDIVPINIQGAVIRPVDEKAVMRLIRASKGKIAIPGIVYEETVRTSIGK